MYIFVRRQHWGLGTAYRVGLQTTERGRRFLRGGGRCVLRVALTPPAHAL